VGIFKTDASTQSQPGPLDDRSIDRSTLLTSLKLLVTEDSTFTILSENLEEDEDITNLSRMRKVEEGLKGLALGALRQSFDKAKKA